MGNIVKSTDTMILEYEDEFADGIRAKMGSIYIEGLNQLDPEEDEAREVLLMKTEKLLKPRPQTQSRK